MTVQDRRRFHGAELAPHWADRHGRWHDLLVGPTVLVAASNAADATKRRAQYVCDGVADNLEIQAAIDALPVGGKVVLSEGTFTLADNIDAVGDMILMGQGYATKLIMLAGSPGTQKNAINIVSVNNVEICFLQIDGNRGNIDDLGNANIQHGIYSATAINCKLHDLWIHDCWEMGIFMNGGSDGFQVWAVHSYANHHNGIGGYDCQYTQVWNCLCYDAVAGSGLDFDDCIECTIGPIICHSNAWNGINIYSTASATADVKVISPICVDNGQQGVYVKGPSVHVTVTDPSCRNNGLSGVKFELQANNAKILGGVCEGNANHGVHVKDNCDDGSIVGVTLPSNTWEAIKIEDSTNDRWLIEANQISGDSIDDEGTGTVIRNNRGYVTENGGAASSVADGGTIAHGLVAIPSHVSVIGSVINENISVSALDGANITVQIQKTTDQSSGTSQTIYWRAWV